MAITEAPCTKRFSLVVLQSTDKDPHRSHLPALYIPDMVNGHSRM